jgi:hypothetical protein
MISNLSAEGAATAVHPPDLTALISDADRNREKHRECCQVFARQMRVGITLIQTNIFTTFDKK